MHNWRQILSWQVQPEEHWDDFPDTLQTQSWQRFLGDIPPEDRGIMASLLTADNDHIVALLCIPPDTTITDLVKDMVDSGFTEDASLFHDMVERAKRVAWEATEEFTNVMRVEEVRKYYKTHYPNDELKIINDWRKVKKAFKEIVDSYNLPDKESSKLSWQDSTYGGKYDIGDLVFDPLSKRFGKVTFVGPLSKVEGMDKGKKIYLTKHHIRNEKKSIPLDDDPMVMLLDLSVGFAHYEGNIQSPNEFMAIDPPKTVIRGLTSGVKKVKKLPEEGDSHEDIFETPSSNHTYFKDAGLSLEVVGQGISKISWQTQKDLIIYPYPYFSDFGYCIGILQADKNKEGLLAVKRLDSAKNATTLIEMAFEKGYVAQLWERWQEKELDYISPKDIVDRFELPDHLRHLAWQVVEPILKVGDKVKIIASVRKLRDLDIVRDLQGAICTVESIDNTGTGTMGIYHDDTWMTIKDNATGVSWWLPYHHWQEFLEIVESKEAALTPADKEEWLQIIKGEQ